MRKINCFIASAFGYKDVDWIFDKCIKIVLKELEIKPLRVDRINHNDKIDKKILDLIKKSDFAIVDLTYARPSAYYEAGYLEGLNRPVIYISRSDHFIPKEKDTLGTEKIHFDLITKNIIPWTKPSLEFSKKLKSRIILVIKPIQVLLNKSNEIEESKNSFEQLSLINRIELLNNSTKEFLLGLNYKDIPDNAYQKNIFKKGNKFVSIYLADKITKDIFSITELGDSLYSDRGEELLRIYVLLNSVSKSMIEKSLRLYTPIAENVYQSGKVKIAILDSINSTYKLKEKLKEIIKE